MLLSRDAILSANDIAFEDVPCPEWGGTVRVKALTGKERDAYEQSLIKGRGKNRDLNYDNARAKMLAIAVIDDSGNRIFTDTDVHALGRKSARPIERVFAVAQRLAGLTDEDVEDLTEDFAAAQTDS